MCVPLSFTRRGQGEVTCPAWPAGEVGTCLVIVSSIIMLEGIISGIKEILFPIGCVDCGVEGEWLCEQCRQKLKFNSHGACPVCGILSPLGVPCKNCAAVSHLNGATALFNYDEQGVVGRLIKLLKYNGASDTLSVWPKIFSDYTIPSVLTDATVGPLSFTRACPVLDTGRGQGEVNCLSGTIHIIPVPLHPRRLRERGFNQATLLVKSFLSAHPQLNWHLDDKNLVRARYTVQQAKLSGTERRVNLAGAFAWRGTAPAPERIIIFDDVYTTGTTAQECAKVLKQSGARTVHALTVARG